MATSLRDALLDPCVTRILFSPCLESMDASAPPLSAVTRAMESIVGSKSAVTDYIVHVGNDNISLLKTLVGFQSIATFGSIQEWAHPFRLVVIDDVRVLLGHRGMSTMLWNFLTALRVTSTSTSTTPRLKVVMCIGSCASLPTLKRLKSPAYCDSIVEQTQERPLISTRDRLSAIIHDAVSSKQLTGNDLEVLTASRADTVELLEMYGNELKSQKSKSQKSNGSQDAAALLDHARSEVLAAQLDNAGTFDDLNMAMASTIRILSTINLLKAYANSM